MQWDELKEETARRAACPQEETEAVLNAFLDALAAAMKTETRIALRSDFGAFAVRELGGQLRSAARPQYTKVQRRAVFKPASALEKALRQSDEEFIRMLQALGAGRQAETLLRAKEKEVRKRETKTGAEPDPPVSGACADAPGDVLCGGESRKR